MLDRFLSFLYFVFEFFAMLTLVLLKVPIILSFLIATIFTLLIMSSIRKRICTRWNNILDDQCDPEQYLKVMEDRYTKCENKELPKNAAMINMGLAYMVMGKLDEAKDILLKVDTKPFPKKSDSHLIYAIDLTLCYYMLGEIEEAEKIYETKLVQLITVNKKVSQAVSLLVAERFYYLGRYEESEQQLKSLQKYELSKRQYLTVLYYLARIEELKGDVDSASKKYSKIAKLGNKLWIAEDARERMNGIEEV